ncbi:MAG: hypothetical protein ACI9MR_001550 [Myxococcota bacterium]|jgi:hypothetical protein
MHRIAPLWLRLSLAGLLLGACASSETVDPTPRDGAAAVTTALPTPVDPVAASVIYAHSTALIRAPKGTEVEYLARVFADGAWERSEPQQGAPGTIRKGQLTPEQLTDLRTLLLSASPDHAAQTKLCRAMPLFEYALHLDGKPALTWRAPCGQRPSEAVRETMEKVEAMLVWTPPMVPLAPDGQSNGIR